MKQKAVIYQMLPRLFGNRCPDPVAGGDIRRNGCGKLNDISPRVLDSLRSLGVTHVWYTGVIEHAHATDYSEFGIRPDNPLLVKGKAGSPYAISDYYDIDPDLAVDVPSRMDEFVSLVERTHKAGLKVIIDFVPNHVARQYHSDAKPAGIEDFGVNDDKDKFFAPNNNYYYQTRQQFAPHVDIGDYVEFPAKATGNDCYTAFPGPNDWYETCKLNYGRDPGDGDHFDPVPDTWLKMLHILRFWAAKGIDGFRCDMAHMVPLEFWLWALPQVREKYPHVIFIAEIYDVALYRPFLQPGAFDYLYDKVNLYDTLRAVQTAGHSAATITNCWQTVDGIGGRMLNFLENHDEQRFASDFYCGDASKVLPSLIVSSMISTGPFMLYYGQELGERGMDAEGFSGRDGRTTIFDYWSMEKLRRWFDGGTCKGMLTEAEAALRGTYATVLRLLNAEPAFAEGLFFDLMYANYANPGIEPHRHFAFIRSHGDDIIIICVNFSDTAANMAVNIPLHAFDYLEMPQGTDRSARELLTGAKAAKELSPTAPFTASVAPYGATIWKLSRKRLNSNRKNSK